MEPQVSISVYDCRTHSNKIAALVKNVQSDQFDPRVQPWADGCQSKYPRYHFVASAGDDILGWMTADIRTHAPKSGRIWTYVYLDKVSARNGTKGVGRKLGDYLKTWAENQREVDFIWLWAINERVSDIYETSWLYERVQYYDGYGFMFYTIRRSPPLSMLQSILPEHPRVYWVAADMVAKMKPPSQTLVELIAKNRRGDVEPVRLILANLMDELPNLDEEGVKDVQNRLIEALPLKKGGGKTARNTHRLRFFRKHHLPVRGYSLGELSKVSKVSRPILQQVYDRGIGAYKTNPTSVRMKGTFKKGVKAPYSKKLSKEQWAMARVYSFLDGNPKHDTDLRRKTRRRHK
jgi:hypothetical protein